MGFMEHLKTLSSVSEDQAKDLLILLSGRPTLYVMTGVTLGYTGFFISRNFIYS